MSDPIFLRNLLSGSVYAEQMNNAQLQGQQAARERAARLRQEEIRKEQASIQRMTETENPDIEERERNGARSDQEPAREEETVNRKGEDADVADAPGTSELEGRRIDLTV